MKVAVLMSTYNGETYIEEQLSSIFSQEGDFQLDLWVRDDGSSDRTTQILQAYADKGLLHWFSGPNLRPEKSFLTLIQHCPGYDYYAFADQDDYWDPDKLHSGIALMGHSEKPALSFANARLVDGARRSLDRTVFQRQIPCDFYSRVCSGGVLGCTVMFNDALAKLVQDRPLPEKLIMHDSYLAILCTLFDGTIYYDSTPHMDYRQHGNNVVGTNWTKLDALRDRIHRITRPEKISIAEQAQSLLDLYSHIPDPDKHDFLLQVANYRTSFIRAVSLSMSKKPRFNSKNMEITLRLAILLRNR